MTEDQRVARGLAAAGIDTTGIFIRTRTVPWNANRWAYHRRTTVIPTATDGTAETCYRALAGIDGAAEVTFIDGKGAGANPLRPQVWVVWS